MAMKKGKMKGVVMEDCLEQGKEQIMGVMKDQMMDVSMDQMKGVVMEDCLE